MDQSSKARTNERPIHRACLVAGCPCKAERTVSARPTAVAAAVAATTGETVADIAHRISDGGSSGYPLPDGGIASTTEEQLNTDN